MAYIPEKYQSTEIISEWALMLDFTHEEVIQNKVKGKVTGKKKIKNKTLNRALMTYGTVPTSHTYM